MEHFVTLFDHKFLPCALALRSSLERHAQPFVLWAICMDAVSYEQMLRLDRPHVRAVHVRELEDARLRHARTVRTWAEYCWTLSSFSCRYVLELDPSVRRVTYVDADVCLFKCPGVLFSEFEQSGMDVQITEHAFDPKYAGHADRVGRFCVQFQTFNNTSRGREVLTDWGEKCLLSCSSDPGSRDTVFGDQKYLDEWPERFGDRVHVLSQVRETLAPWNANHYLAREIETHQPVIFHFHGFRIISPHFVRCSQGYPVQRARRFYNEYMSILGSEINRMRSVGIPVPCIPLSGERHWVLKTMKRWCVSHLVIRRHHWFSS